MRGLVFLRISDALELILANFNEIYYLGNLLFINKLHIFDCNPYPYNEKQQQNMLFY